MLMDSEGIVKSEMLEHTFSKIMSFERLLWEKRKELRITTRLSELPHGSDI